MKRRTLVLEVEGAYGRPAHDSRIAGRLGNHFVRIGIIERAPVETAQGKTQVLHGIVVDAGDEAQLVGRLELEGRAGAVLDEVFRIEQVGVQAGDDLGFIPPVGRPAPQADSRVMPGGGKDRALAFRTIDSEEVQGLVGIVQAAHGNDHMADAHVEFRSEAFLDPELFQLHFPAFLHLGLPLAGFLEFLLGSGAGPGVFELDFRLHGPSLPEVVSQVDDGVGDVETAVLLALVRSRGRIAVNVVTIEVAAQGDFAVPAHRQTLCRGRKKRREAGEKDDEESFHGISVFGRQSYAPVQNGTIPIFGDFFGAGFYGQRIIIRIFAV